MFEYFENFTSHLALILADDSFTTASIYRLYGAGC